MRFSITTLMATSIAATALAAPSLNARADIANPVANAAAAAKSARGDAFSDFTNGVGASTQATSPNAANGRCGINIPPNEFDQVPSSNCA
ncbi:uncharacterized protein PAC_06543 [Phialocephala subalpina]|uniref:Uncharacterized protein n=1 Tax=Phialocephala subalpina TaxID=576137 RepID=A0A1L7WV55_9HELO|nr:uncharacterized protein PAC_06543 [Phialocephala subalpina]